MPLPAETALSEGMTDAMSPAMTDAMTGTMAGTMAGAAPQFVPLPSLCVFGDSHIASVKLALDRGLLPYVTDHLEFWGAEGPSFRLLDFRNNAVIAPKRVQPIVARINGMGREVLEGDAFSAILFYGARLRMSKFLPRQVAILCNGGHLSRAVRSRAARNFLEAAKPYRMARNFAKANPGTRITFAPAPLLTQGIGHPGWIWPGSEKAGPQERAEVRGWLDEEAAKDGVTLLHQPDETVVDGCFTDPVWAVEEGLRDQDGVHKSAEFAAMMIGRYREMMAG